MIVDLWDPLSIIIQPWPPPHPYGQFLIMAAPHPEEGQGMWNFYEIVDLQQLKYFQVTFRTK